MAPDAGSSKGRARRYNCWDWISSVSSTSLEQEITGLPSLFHCLALSFLDLLLLSWLANHDDRMLAVMTGNVGYFLSVLGGIFVGSVFFGRFEAAGKE